MNQDSTVLENEFYISYTQNEKKKSLRKDVISSLKKLYVYYSLDGVNLFVSQSNRTNERKLPYSEAEKWARWAWAELRFWGVILGV